jgi:hypothetical protein
MWRECAIGWLVLRRQWLLGFEIELPARVKNAEEDHLLPIDQKRNGNPALETDHPQTGPNLIMDAATFRKGVEAGNETCNPSNITAGYRRRRSVPDEGANVS